MNEFVIKNGFISKGDSIVSGSLSGETLNLTTTPSNDNSQTQVLVRNNTTGIVEYRDASSLSGTPGTNTFVTGTTFGGNQAILTRNDGTEVFKLSGSSSVQLSNPSGNKIDIDVTIPAGMNTYVTGFTYDDVNTFTITDNLGTAFTSTINTVTGLTVNGGLSATTVSACTGIYTSNLYGCSPITVHDNIQSITSSATGSTSFAFGKNVNAFGNYSHAEGYSTTASGYGSHAEGKDTVASGYYSHAEGEQTTASYYSAHAEGDNTTASGNASHAEGSATIASGSYSHSEGSSAVASGNYASHAEGYYTTASGDYGSHAEGNYTTASGNYGSHAGGKGVDLTNNIIASGDTSFVHFRQTSASGNIGAYGDYSAILGGNDHNIGTGSISSGIFAGSENVINDNVLRSAVLGGSLITGTTDDTVYVPNLNIGTVGAGASVNNLGIDTNGNVVTGTTGGGGATIDPYQNEGNVSVTIDWVVSGRSTNYEATLTGDTTLNMSEVRNGDYGTLIVTQDGTGSRTLTFGGGTNKVVNGGGGTPTLTTTAGATDILSFTYNGSIFYWTVGNDYT